MNQREIKFRAWDSRIGEFHYWDYQTQSNKNIFWQVCRNENLSINQYTGITDVDGKEIYEGDVLNLNPDISIERFAFVVFKDGAFQYQYITMPQAPDEYRFEYHNMTCHKIIGNIYENHELCEKI